MKVKVRLCWSRDNSRVVLKSDPDAGAIFAREGAYIPHIVAKELGILDYVEPENEPEPIKNEKSEKTAQRKGMNRGR